LEIHACPSTVRGLGVNQPVVRSSPRYIAYRARRPISALPNKALQLTVKGRAPINCGRIWRRSSALRAVTAAVLAGS